MVTGDAQATAEVVAGWSDEGRCGDDALPEIFAPTNFDLRRVLPRTSITSSSRCRTVASGRNVRDGANDAPALSRRKWESPFSRPPTSPNRRPALFDRTGPCGIVTSVKEGRRTFQRILTYTLRSIVHK